MELTWRYFCASVRSRHRFLEGPNWEWTQHFEDMTRWWNGQSRSSPWNSFFIFFNVQPNTFDCVTFAIDFVRCAVNDSIRSLKQAHKKSWKIKTVFRSCSQVTLTSPRILSCLKWRLVNSANIVWLSNRIEYFTVKKNCCRWSTNPSSDNFKIAKIVMQRWIQSSWISFSAWASNLHAATSDITCVVVHVYFDKETV